MLGYIPPGRCLEDQRSGEVDTGMTAGIGARESSVRVGCTASVNSWQTVSGSTFCSSDSRPRSM